MPLFATPVPSLRSAVLSHRVLQAQTTQGVHSLLFWRCIALRCAGASGATRTLGVLAAADLDELLDVGNFGRHLDDLCVDGSLEFGIVKFGDA